MGRGVLSEGEKPWSRLLTGAMSRPRSPAPWGTVLHRRETPKERSDAEQNKIRTGMCGKRPECVWQHSAKCWRRVGESNPRARICNPARALDFQRFSVWQTG